MSDTENRANETEDTARPVEPDTDRRRVVLVPVPPIELLRYAADLETVCAILFGVIIGLVLVHFIRRF